jgi:hypothetical protein
MMLTGYFDDSGHITNRKVLVVGGFVASIGEWKQYEKDWRAVLRRPEFGLDYLHMKEFRNYAGQSAKFKDNLELERDLFRRLHSVIKNRAQQSFGCLMDLQAYERVNQEFELRETHGHPFAMAGAITIHKTLRWMEATHPNDRIEFVFDHGSDGHGELEAQAKKRFSDDVLPIPGWFKKQTPLQASDHVAWELHRAMNAVIDNGYEIGGVTFRGSFDALILQWGGEHWNVVDESELRKVCDDANEPTPRRVITV